MLVICFAIRTSKSTKSTGGPLPLFEVTCRIRGNHWSTRIMYYIVPHLFPSRSHVFPALRLGLFPAASMLPFPLVTVSNHAKNSHRCRWRGLSRLRGEDSKGTSTPHNQVSDITGCPPPRYNWEEPSDHPTTDPSRLPYVQPLLWPSELPLSEQFLASYEQHPFSMTRWHRAATTMTTWSC